MFDGCLKSRSLLKPTVKIKWKTSKTTDLNCNKMKKHYEKLWVKTTTTKNS